MATKTKRSAASAAMTTERPSNADVTTATERGCRVVPAEPYFPGNRLVEGHFVALLPDEMRLAVAFETEAEAYAIAATWPL